MTYTRPVGKAYVKGYADFEAKWAVWLVSRSYPHYPYVYALAYRWQDAVDTAIDYNQNHYRDFQTDAARG